MTLILEDGVLVLTYIKRKVVMRLEKHRLETNNVVLMLYGKGDSVALD